MYQAEFFLTVRKMSTDKHLSRLTGSNSLEAFQRFTPPLKNKDFTEVRGEGLSINHNDTARHSLSCDEYRICVTNNTQLSVLKSLSCAFLSVKKTIKDPNPATLNSGFCKRSAGDLRTIQGGRRRGFAKDPGGAPPGICERSGGAPPEICERSGGRRREFAKGLG